MSAADPPEFPAGFAVDDTGYEAGSSQSMLGGWRPRLRMLPSRELSGSLSSARPVVR
jgi:hypothetical protein